MKEGEGKVELLEIQHGNPGEFQSAAVQTKCKIDLTDVLCEKIIYISRSSDGEQLATHSLAPRSFEVLARLRRPDQKCNVPSS